MPSIPRPLTSEGAPRIYPAIGAEQLETHLACECGWLGQLEEGATLWQLLMAWTGHLAAHHDDQDLNVAVQLAQLLGPVLLAEEAARV